MKETDKMLNDCRLTVVEARRSADPKSHANAMLRSAHTLLSSFSVIFGQYSQHHKDTMKVFGEVAHQYKRVKAAILELLTGEVIGTPSVTPSGSPKKSLFADVVQTGTVKKRSQKEISPRFSPSMNSEVIIPPSAETDDVALLNGDDASTPNINP